MRPRTPSTIILIPLLVVGSSSIVRATEPDPGPSSPSAVDDQGNAPTSPEVDERPSESSPTDDEPSTEPSQPNEDPTLEESFASTEEPEPSATETPPPKVYDYDTPDLERRDRYPSASSTTTGLSSRDLRRARVGGLLVGLGVTAAVVAPIVVLRPRTPITVDVGDGTSLNLDTDGGPLVTGSIVSVVGGVSSVLGGRLLSDLGREALYAPGRRRALNVASGVAFGVASGLLVAGVVDLGRGGALWNAVLEREFAAEDVTDGEQAGRRLSRGLAMLTAVPPMAGLGLGLGLGGDARARVMPSQAGFAVVGRF